MRRVFQHYSLLFPISVFHALIASQGAVAWTSCNLCLISDLTHLLWPTHSTWSDLISWCRHIRLCATSIQSVSCHLEHLLSPIPSGQPRSSHPSKYRDSGCVHACQTSFGWQLYHHRHRTFVSRQSSRRCSIQCWSLILTILDRLELLLSNRCYCFQIQWTVIEAFWDYLRSGDIHPWETLQLGTPRHVEYGYRNDSGNW